MNEYDEFGRDDHLGDPSDPGPEPEPTHEIVPLDEPSMEDYPDGFADDPTSPGHVSPQFLRVSRCWCVGPECQGADSLPADEFCFQEKQGVVPVRDGLR